MNTLDDTIAAVATPLGEAGLSVIRVSGARSIEICAKKFQGKKGLYEAASHTAHFGNFTGPDGEIIDEVVATVFRAPHSYTTEDVVEISCHGGIFNTKSILESLVASGARHAEPGEFTKRAFLNGRIDLSQAEAVADLIHSRSKMSHRASIHQLSGTISIKVKALRQQILDLSSLIELEMDFIEEGIDLLKIEELKEKLLAIQRVIDEMISSSRQGRIIREGIRVVITGKPNVGKSSILNSLLNYDRAIVSEVPGTTRDTLEENISIEGFLFSVTDTAGLRSTADEVEGLGIERARRELRNADVILYVSDASIGPDKEDFQTLRDCGLEAKEINTTIMWLQNKIDLVAPKTKSIEMSFDSGITPKRISAKTREGIDSLRTELVEIASAGAKNSFDSSYAITNQRHKRCLERARDLLEMAISLASDKAKSELIAANLNSATNALGEVIGIVTTDDLLNNIFSKFCIGK